MSSIARLLASLALAAAVLVPGLARAQQARNLTGDAADDSQSIFRGSTLVYEPVQTTPAYWSKGFDPQWNPYYAHQLTLRPEVHFHKDFFIRGNFSFTQELTLNDSADYPRQLLFGDTQIDAIYPGFTEKNSKIRVGASLRTVIPTSKASQAATLRLGLAPGLTATRMFPGVMKGLILGYTTRLAMNFNGSSTSMRDENPIESCRPGNASCDSLQSFGRRNVSWGLTHGPMVILMPAEPLSVTFMFSQTRSQLYPLSGAVVPTATGDVTLDPDAGVNARWSQLLLLDFTYTVTPDLYLSLGGYAWGAQLGQSGVVQNPVHPRNITMYLDVGIDVERLTARLRGRKL